MAQNRGTSPPGRHAISPAKDILRRPARPLVRTAREAAVWPRILGQALTGQGRPSVAFLPARGRSDGATRLRIHAMAARLASMGWRVTLVPWRLTLAQRHRVLAAVDPDVIVMQGARHDLNRPALYPQWPVVYDMDDADFHLPHLEGPVRAAMGQVALVVAGSRYVAEWCRAGGAPAAEVIWTGTPVSTRPRPPQAGRPPVVAWAQTRPMTYGREADLVRQVTRRLAAVRPGLTLRLYDRRSGDDPAFAESFRAPGLTVEWRKSLGYSDYIASFDDVAVGLAPLSAETPFSRGKSFGKVLAYLDRCVPVIASDSGEHGAFFTPETGLVSDDPETWVAGAGRLLSDPALRQAQAGRAFMAFQARLTDRAAAARLEAVLARMIPRDAARRTG